MSAPGATAQRAAANGKGKRDLTIAQNGFHEKMNTRVHNGDLCTMRVTCIHTCITLPGPARPWSNHRWRTACSVHQGHVGMKDQLTDRNQLMDSADGFE